MVPYFGRHRAKQYIHEKPLKFGYKLWVMATPLGYCIQFLPYTGKDGGLNKYMDVGLGLGGAVVASLTQALPKIAHSNYHIVIDNFFTSPSLLRYLKEKEICGTGAVRATRMEDVPSKFTVDVEKSQRGTSDFVVGKLLITLVFL